MPIVIFHGSRDEIILYHSALKLKELFKPMDTFIILNGQGHNGMSSHPEYIAQLKKILK
ncbi:MAG: alpha/beta hydrolase [Flavisolibacter sp.]|nr:alpha/beta hydrolase [Flavisolibacter sp.]